MVKTPSPSPIEPAIQPTSSFIISPQPPLLTPIVNQVPLFTGAKEVTLTPDEETVVKQEFQLRNRMPVETNGFTIIHDYQLFKFIVTIQEPYDQNKQIFKQWLRDNGFGNIPNEDIVIKPF